MSSNEAGSSEVELIRIMVRFAWRNFTAELQADAIDNFILKNIVHGDVLAAGARIWWLNYDQALFLALVAQILWESGADNPHLKFPGPSTGARQAPTPPTHRPKATRRRRQNDQIDR